MLYLGSQQHPPPHLLSRSQGPVPRSLQPKTILLQAPGGIQLITSPPRLETFHHRPLPSRRHPNTTVVRDSLPHWGLQRILPWLSQLAGSGESLPLPTSLTASPMPPESPYPLPLRHSDKGRRNTVNNQEWCQSANQVSTFHVPGPSSPTAHPFLSSKLSLEYPPPECGVEPKELPHPSKLRKRRAFPTVLALQKRWEKESIPCPLTCLFLWSTAFFVFLLFQLWSCSSR